MPSFEYFRNLYWQYIFEKLEKADSSPSSLLTRYNTTHPEEQHLPLKQMRTTTIFFIWIPILQLATLIFFVKTVKLIWLLFLTVLSFNFVPTPGKSLKFTRFRRSYTQHPVVVLTNNCQRYTVFLLDVRCSKWPRSFFCSPMIVQLRFWTHLLLECC